MASPLSPATEEFGSRIQIRRKELGWSQEKLAEVTGLHWTYIGQVERGERNISLRNILKLLHSLQIHECEAGVLAQLEPW